MPLRVNDRRRLDGPTTRVIEGVLRTLPRLECVRLVEDDSNSESQLININADHNLFGVTFVHGLHAPIVWCCTLRFQILFPQKA